MTRDIIMTPDGGHLEVLTTGGELAAAGSGVVVVPASMVTAADYTRFAQKLSEALVGGDDDRIAQPTPLFPRLEIEADEEAAA